MDMSEVDEKAASGRQGGRNIDESSNARLSDFAWVLNDLVVDLATSTTIWLERSTSAFEDQVQAMSLNRHCLQAAVVSLCKVNDLLVHYRPELASLPADAAGKLSALRKEIHRRGLPQFRNKYVAHTVDKKRGRPLTLAEGTEAVRRALDAQTTDPVAAMAAFVKWVHVPGKNVGTVTADLHAVVKTLEGMVGGSLGARP